MCLAAGLAAGVGHAATFVVSTVGDTGDSNTADNLCVATGGGCTLRAAIQQANATGGADIINFGIGTGAKTISPTSALPAVSEQVTIDGRTQPGVSAPGITLNGGSAGAGANGIVLGANGCQVYGLIVRSFSNHGIVVNGANGTIARNYIGTDGSADVGNGVYGIAVTGGNNTIGGPAAAYADRNVISGNNGAGLFISGSGNLVQSDFIGTNSQGTAAVGNGVGVVLSSASNNTFRTQIISGNTGDGVRIVGGTTNTIQDNSFIGLNNGATAAIPNGANGVYIETSTSNVIGNTDLISGNAGAGVYLTGATASGNQVWGNFIGLGFSGGNQVAIGNGGAGVVLTGGAHDNVIGGLSTGTGNVISGNTGQGVLLLSAGVNNQVVSNVIGAGQGPGGTAVAIPNHTHGVQVQSSPNSKIGIDASTGSGNTISGNLGNGVYVTGSDGTVVAGDAIGSGQGGIVPLANSGHGIAVETSNSVTIGGTTSGKDNEVSGNGQNGIYIVGGTGHQILNNAVGVDGNGTVAVPNGADGILLQNTTGTLITTVNSSGNTGHGIRIIGGSGATLHGNYVGTNLASTQAVPNGGHGILLDSTSGVTIGGPLSGDGNIVSGNVGTGIFLLSSSNNTITADIVGLNAAADTALPNAGGGIVVQSSSDNVIGGTAQNRIAGNTGIGVAVLSGQRNRVRPNMVYLNGGLGIDLDRDGALPFDGVTFDDPGDGDSGANGLLNAPILTSASTSSVNGRLKTAPGLSITVDLYRSTSCDASGFGEASVFINSTTVATDGSGAATWSIGGFVANASDAFAATATDASGNSSELSQCISPNRKPVETLVLFNPSTHAVSLIATLTDPLSAVAGAYSTFTSYPTGQTAGGKWVMGDWNGDGFDTPAVYLDNGLYFYTNDIGATSNWVPIWFGLLGKPPVAGRFNAALANDCLGVVDSAPAGIDDAFNLYYACDLASGSNPPKLGQWLSLVLPSSQGFTGTHQFVSGDFDASGADSIGVRRGVVVSWTNVAPSVGAAQFNFAQYVGVPPGASGEGNAAVGDWDGDGISSWGLVYQDGTFQRRNDLLWNSGAYTLQRVGQTIGTPTTPDTWRPGGSAP